MNSWASALFKKAYFVSQLYVVADPSSSYQLFTLGDSAITIDLGNCIDDQLNRGALALYVWLTAHRFPGVLDILVAYSSVSVFYDPLVVRAGGITGGDTAAEWVGGWLARGWTEAGVHKPEAGQAEAGQTPGSEGRLRSEEGPIVSIPVCYEGEYAPDLEWVARQKGLSGPEVVSIHTKAVYRVYMVGFLPGFPYMGIVDEQIQLARKPRPVPVIAGGVGIAGLQTGIYPMNSPGGWQIIGRTPMRFFEAGEDPPIRLKTGDMVRFCPIPASDFRRLSAVPGSKIFI